MAYLAVQDEILLLDYGTYVDAQWGVLHEWGHNHQLNSNTIPYTGETTCNWWSLFGMEAVRRANRTARYTNRRAETLAYWATGAYPADFDALISMHMYMSLLEVQIYLLAPGSRAHS